jgi:hypothetical protein
MNIKAKAEEIKTQGFCILRDELPKDALAECFDAFLPILKEHAEKHQDNPNRGPERHYITLPFRHPFYDERFFFNEKVLAISESVLGENIRMDQYASDTPSKGSVYQDVHADLPLLFPDQPDLIIPPHILAVNFPFIDITPENGPFEVARGSHLFPKEDGLKKIEDGEIPFDALLMNAGDVMIRDPRCLHRGTPNRTDTPRPMAVIGIFRDWHCRRREYSPLPESIWAGLTERQRYLFERIPRAEDSV